MLDSSTGSAFLEGDQGMKRFSMILPLSIFVVVISAAVLGGVAAPSVLAAEPAALRGTMPTVTPLAPTQSALAWAGRTQLPWPSVSGFSVKTERCTSVSRGVLWYQGDGPDLMAGYYQRVDWCYDKGLITSVARSRWAEVYTGFTSFLGHVGSQTSGGVGHAYYTSWTQGEFSWVWPNPRLHVEITVRGDGTWTSSYGIS
jgi:hypothetical protein